MKTQVDFTLRVLVIQRRVGSLAEYRCGIDYTAFDLLSNRRRGVSLLTALVCFCSQTLSANEKNIHRSKYEKEVLELVRSKSAIDRTKAAEKIGPGVAGYSTECVLKVLGALARDQEVAVRRAVANSLVTVTNVPPHYPTGSASALKKLRPTVLFLIDDKDKYVRETAKEALERLDGTMKTRSK